MNLARLAMLTSPFLVTCVLHSSPILAQGAPPPVDRVHQVDLDALRALLDDDIPGNSSNAYRQLLARGAKARASLRKGLQSSDWQQRLLSALLFVQLGPEGADLELVSRILIGHLNDNRFRGDARLAENGIVALGGAARPYLKAASWRAEGQLADKCKLLLISLSKHRRDKTNRGRAEASLQSANLNTAWIGKGAPQLPQLSAPLPTVPERMQQHLLDLGSDERQANANVAFDAFSIRYYSTRDPQDPAKWSPIVHGLPANEQHILPLLWEALESKDRQRRQLCASLLASREVAPTPALLRTLIEALAPDEFGSSSTLPVANANHAAEYLVANIAEASPYLHKALRAKSKPGSSTEIQRIRAAAVLAQGRDSKLADYVPFLVSRLASNDCPEDAALCGRSLALLGRAALPWIDADPVDKQQAHYFAAIRKSIQIREGDPDARIPFSQGGMYSFER